ncbi:MAG: hypothetical protein ABJE10_16650 [bacterium]
MRMPMQARPATSRVVLLASALFLGACASNEVTSPAATSPSRAVEASSTFVPTAATKALIGVVDGTYTVELDPTHAQSFALGPNHLDIPANSVCNLLTSGYGADYWNRACAPQQLPVVLTVVIKGSKGNHPEVQFFPAMRFNPTKSVQLYIYAPKVSRDDAKNWLMLYSPDHGKKIDESLTDRDLITYIDYTHNVLFRRVKHFSGYVVAENDGNGGGIQP